MNVVSACCHRPIVAGSRLEYPLGGSTWAVSCKVDICECCGLDIDDVGSVEECEECGLPGCKGNCEQLEMGVENDEFNANAARE